LLKLFGWRQEQTQPDESSTTARPRRSGTTTGLCKDRHSGQDGHLATAVHPREPDRVLHRAQHAPERPDVREDQAVEKVQGPPARARVGGGERTASCDHAQR